jgi:uncharacterized protein (TIGR02246 family)
VPVRRPRAARFARTRSRLTLRPLGVGSRIGAAALGIVAVALTGCVSAGGPVDERVQILQLDREWSEAAQRRDVERVLSYWANDAVVLPPGSPPVVGKPAIREFVVKSFQAPDFSISWKTTEVTVSGSGDLAYATGTNRVTFRSPDGKQMTVEGKAVTVWRRETSGSWKCVVDIWNDTPSSSR